MFMVKIFKKMLVTSIYLQLTIKYYIRISSDTSKLTHKALISEQELHGNGNKTWFSFLTKIVNTADMSLQRAIPMPNPLSVKLKTKYEVTLIFRYN